MLVKSHFSKVKGAAGAEKNGFWGITRGKIEDLGFDYLDQCMSVYAYTRIHRGGVYAVLGEFWVYMRVGVYAVLGENQGVYMRFGGCIRDHDC